MYWLAKKERKFVDFGLRSSVIHKINQPTKWYLSYEKRVAKTKNNGRGGNIGYASYHMRGGWSMPSTFILLLFSSFACIVLPVDLCTWLVCGGGAWGLHYAVSRRNMANKTDDPSTDRAHAPPTTSNTGSHAPRNVMYVCYIGYYISPVI